eukprot:366750-Amphidinium_carterae.1
MGREANQCSQSTEFRHFKVIAGTQALNSVICFNPQQTLIVTTRERRALGDSSYPHKSSAHARTQWRLLPITAS